MKQLYLPCLRGRMGDWAYYSCIMKIKDVAARVNFAEEIHKSKKLSELIQRALWGTRGKQIKEYLLTNKERFFNSMIVAVYEGDPEWYEVGNITSKTKKMQVEEIPLGVIESIGILSFSGKEKFFALDGQHRLSGIRKALDKKPELGEEEISVIFVAHENTESGLQRSRRLFTVLNKTAKAVSKREIIALDEDDTMAIITRKLIEENKYFRDDRISYEKGNNIPAANNTSLTTIENLYDLLETMFKKIFFHTTKATLTRNRLSDADLDTYYKGACTFFDKLFKTIEPLKEHSKENYKEAVAKYRTKQGGSIYYRPLGLSIIINVIASLNKKYTWQESVNLISQLPHNLQEVPYKGVIWHPSKGTIITKGKTLATKLLLYMLNEETNPGKLLEEYRKALDDEAAVLPRKITQ